MWEDLPLEVKLKIFAYLPAAGEHQLALSLEEEAEAEEHGEETEEVPRWRQRRRHYEEVSREWHALLWQERLHLDFSLSAAVRDMSNEEASLRRALERCKRLETLNLSYCPVSDDSLAAFTPFGPTLRVLVLSSCPQVSNDGLLHLANLGAVRKLERLALAGCMRITGQGVVNFVAHCPMLQDLDISGVWGFGDSHMKALVETARHLKRLNLGGTSISDTGLHHLLSSDCAPNLEYVGLANCTYITPSSTQGGITKIGTCCPSLLELDLSYLSQVRDITLSFILERCTKIEALSIIKCESINSSRTAACLSKAPCLRTVYVSRYQAIYAFIKRLHFTVPVD